MTGKEVGPITLARQGSFFVGGRQVTAAGQFDPTAPSPDSAGQTFWIGQMYVHYQIPLDARRIPLVLVHGGAGTGAVWESTPDGREGFQTIFLRRGFAVFVVDCPRGGRPGFPSFDGEMGRLDTEQRIVPGHTRRAGREQAWARWRLGPQYPDTFSTQAFAMNGVDQFLRHIRPIVSDDAEVIAAALTELCGRIGPAVLVTHSNSGLPGWLAGGRCPDIKGVVSYEPGFVFPAGEMPAPLTLFTGKLPAGEPIAVDVFDRLAARPIQVVYGDNIPTEPVSNLLADNRRAQMLACRLFVDALNRRGGQASMLHLPKAGLRGNSHFMFSDLNNIDVADQLSAFLAQHALDGR